MNINDRIHTAERLIAIKDEAISVITTELAKLKASRMEDRVLLDDLKHQRRLWVDAAYDAMGVPSEDDIAEHDYQRFVLDYGPREAFLDHVEQVDFDIEQGADR
jgi:hypothetical protein